MLDKNTHYYKNLLGTEIVSPDDPFKEPPRDPKDYKIYRQFYEDKMMEVLNGQGVIKMTVYCEGKDAKLRPIRMKTQKPDHFGCSMVFACHHCIHQDPDSPEGISFVPFSRGSTAGFYLCATCIKLMENRKLDLDSICGKCSKCVLEMAERIALVKPDRLRDYRAL